MPAVATAPVWQQSLGVVRAVRVFALTGEDLEVALADIEAKLTDIQTTLAGMPSQVTLTAIADDVDTNTTDISALVGYVGGLATGQSDIEAAVNTMLPVLTGDQTDPANLQYVRLGVEMAVAAARGIMASMRLVEGVE